MRVLMAMRFRALLVGQAGQGHGAGDCPLPAIAFVLNPPPGREHGLGQSPPAQACALEAKLLGQLVHAARQHPAHLRPVTEFGELVAQQGARVIRRFSGHTLGIDRQPAPLAGIEKDILMMKIAVEQNRRA